MELRRFYVTPDCIQNDGISIEGNEYRHMTGVLRFRPGWKCIVCDNTGYDYLCEVTAIDKTKATLRILEKTQNDAETAYPLTLCCGLIKPDKMEIEIQKAVEIGVQTIRPFRSKNTSETDVRTDRLERIVLEACKQCGRAILPSVMPVVPFEALFAEPSRYYMAYECDREHLLRNVLETPNERGISVIIGSEGGFTEEEARYAAQQGATLCSLGKRILRAETAAIAALATITALTEEL